MAKKILVVDDERMIVEMLEMRLEAEGYGVIKAHNGTEALEKIKESVPDLVLLDIMMPPPDGLEVCRTIKADPVYKNIKIIMLTARSSQDAVKLSIAAGADGHVSKPYDAGALIQKIKELI